MNEIKIKSTENWDEGLPLGNGRTGSLVYGSKLIKITVDRTDLWDLRPNETTLEKDFNFNNLAALSLSGKEEDWKERERLFEDIFMGKPYPSKITAGHIELDFKEDIKSLSYKLDLNNAIVTIFGDNRLVAEAFVCDELNVGVVRLLNKVDLHLHIPTYLSEKANGDSGLGDKAGDMSLCYPKAKVYENDRFKWYEQNTHTHYSFGIVTYQKDDKLFYALATTDDDKDYVEFARKSIMKAVEKGYDKLLSEHKKSWKKYWAKSAVKTGDKLIDETYNKSWYLFKCCSKKGGYPMPLQGVWTADNDCLPPWKGDYHHDTNTELSYQAYLKANRLEEGEAFIEYLWKLKPAYEKFAKDFFGVEGLLLPSCSTLDGKAMGGWAQYSLSPTMTIWAAQSFNEYYLYTGDEKFLKGKAYPFFKEVGKAIKGLLKEKNGKLYLPLSSSPEIFDNTRKAYLEPNSNFDLALMIYLFKTLEIYADKLGDSSEEYREVLNKFDDIAVDENGVVMLDKTQKLSETHRHFSHLMCLYPLHLVNYDTEENKEIYENTILDLEKLGTGYWVGFSFIMSAQIYAMAKKGNAALERLYQFCKGFVAENGFHLNGDYKHFGYTWFHYRPFTLESLYGFCDALQEMLLQDHQGYIHLFPVVPDDWKKRKISFQGLRSYGGVIINAEFDKGTVTKIELQSFKPMCITLKNVFGKTSLEFSDGQKIVCHLGNNFTLNVNGQLNLIN